MKKLLTIVTQRFTETSKKDVSTCETVEYNKHLLKEDDIQMLVKKLMKWDSMFWDIHQYDKVDISIT